jgi:iron complex outermembrane recepter protein
VRNKLTLSIILLSVVVNADEAKTLKLKEIPVTANPLELSSDEMSRSIYIMNGINLQNNKSSSLGNTLEKIPGVSNSAWGDSVGRPVIRGMDRNRIKILNNGLEVRDVSNMSGDHGIALDTMAAEQIEIIRGPESIIYGGGAIGGVVNIVDYRIHPEFVEGVMGKYDASYGGANTASSGSMLVDIGSDNTMFHLDLYNRDTKNLKIPGFSVSEKLANSDPEFTRDKFGKGTLQNSYSESGGGGLGATYFFDKGYTGLSFAKHEQEYGTILEDGAYIDLESDNYKYVLEMRDLSDLISKVKFKLGYNNYQHQEVEDGTASLDFFDQGTDGKIEVVHSLFSQSGGVVGLDFGAFRFSQKNGSFIANNQRNNIGLYALERYAVGKHKLTVGLRHDYQEYDANDFSSDDGAAVSGGGETSTSFAGSKKTFNNMSLSFGTNSKLTQYWSLGFSLAHTERAPTQDELFVYGKHHATETIEHGDRNLKDERSNTIDATLSWANQGNSFSLTPYFTNFSSYIALLDTGVVQYHDHGGVEEALKVFQHQNIPAEFYGLEFQGNINLSANYALSYWGDYVRAKNKNGGDLPRIPPLTLGSGLSYQWSALRANIDIEHKFSQSDIGANELKTDDFTNLSLTMNYELPEAKGLNIFIKGDNLLDEEKRDHTSFLKDMTLKGERSFSVGITGSF